MEIIGNIKKIFDTQNITENFKKREFVIRTNDQYPQDIIIEFTQDRTELLNNYELNDEVKVSINIRGREWTNQEGVTKYFNTIQAWRIEKINNFNSNDSINKSNINIEDNIDSNIDDLPF